MKLLRLSKEDLALARAEAERLHGVAGEPVDDLLLLDADLRPGLAFTRAAYDVLGALDGYDWAGAVTGSYAVRGHGVDERALADAVWRALKDAGRKPVVDLDDPSQEFHVFRRGARTFVTLLAWTNEERFAERRPHLRARNHPTGLSPKLARAMINLAGPVGAIADPFCGAGGLLIEGALAGRKMTGLDIDEEQVARAEENLRALNLDAAVRHGDATREPVEAEAVVTDLPYGKSSRLAPGTFEAFFRNVKTSIVVVATTGDEELPLAGWRVVHEFRWRLHASLEKRILVLER